MSNGKEVSILEFTGLNVLLLTAQQTNVFAVVARSMWVLGSGLAMFLINPSFVVKSVNCKEGGNATTR